MSPGHGPDHARLPVCAPIYCPTARISAIAVSARFRSVAQGHPIHLPGSSPFTASLSYPFVLVHRPPKHTQTHLRILFPL